MPAIDRSLSVCLQVLELGGSDTALFFPTVNRYVYAVKTRSFPIEKTSTGWNLPLLSWNQREIYQSPACIYKADIIIYPCFHADVPLNNNTSSFLSTCGTVPCGCTLR